MLYRYLLLIISSFLLIACGSNGTGIEDGKFTFDEDDFINEYEEQSDKLMTGSVVIFDGSMNVRDVNREEMIFALKALDHLTGDSKIKNVINTFKDKNEVADESEKMTIIIRDDFNDAYTSTFLVTDQ